MTGVSYYMSNSAEAGSSPGNVRIRLEREQTLQRCSTLTHNHVRCMIAKSHRWETITRGDMARRSVYSAVQRLSSTVHVPSLCTGAYKLFPASSDYPDLSQHNNVMASHLTKEVHVDWECKSTFF